MYLFVLSDNRVEQAAEAMGAISSTESVPILREYLSDPNRSVRETCEIALAKIDWDNSEEGRKQHAAAVSLDTTPCVCPSRALFSYCTHLATIEHIPRSILLLRLPVSCLDNRNLKMLRKHLYYHLKKDCLTQNSRSSRGTVRCLPCAISARRKRWMHSHVVSLTTALFSSK